MKRIFALILVVLMLLPSIISCGKTVDPTESSTVPSTTGSSKPGPTTGSSTTGSNPGSTGSSSIGGGNTDNNGGNDKVEKDPEIINNWPKDKDGKTVLNVLATTWNGEEPGAPWSQVELMKDLQGDITENTGFGTLISSAVLTRNTFIKNTYGVEVNWINARGNHIANLLSDAIVSGSGNAKYHLAMPRMLEAQSVVATNGIYDISKSKYINLDKSYYNQVAREAYTVNGVTLFAAGDFSFLDEETAILVYYNEAMTTSGEGGFENFPDLYSMVKEGKWTIDQMANVAKLVSKQLGDPAWNDEDVYGFGTDSLTRFYQYSGIQQVSVKDGQYVITLNDESKLPTLIDKILTLTGATWARTSWEGGYEALQKAFQDGRLLFYNEVVQKTSYFKNQSEKFKVGLLPSPKLNESQDTYYTPCSYMSVLLCVPKATPNRDMSEYFLEILSYTGQKFVMAAYKQNIKNNLNPDTADQSMDIIENYIFKNLCYDVGYMDGWSGLLTSVQSEAYKDGTNNFTAAYGPALPDAQAVIDEWNENWLDCAE